MPFFTKPSAESGNTLFVTFGNTTQAMTMEEKCAAYGLPGALVPVPREIKASCGLAWKTTSDQKEALTQMIKKEKIKTEKFVVRP